MSSTTVNCAAICAFSILLIVAFTSETNASKRQCPVCRQIFDEETVLCPNDGSDLNLSGIPIDDSETDTDSSDESMASDTEEDKENTPSKRVDDDETSKYHRHDLGGERQRLDEMDERGYWDRYKRIGEERRGPEAALERRRKAREKARREFDERDLELKEEFEKNRRSLWDDYMDEMGDELSARRGFNERNRDILWGRAAPFTSLGVRILWMGEGEEKGPVTGAEIDVNMLKTKVRIGLSTMIGVRGIGDRGDLFFSEGVNAGIQFPWRFSPYIVARGGIGALISNRFGSNLTYLVRSFGFDAGIDCRITPWVVLSPSVGYVRMVVDDAYWNSFTAKISIGF